MSRATFGSSPMGLLVAYKSTYIGSTVEVFAQSDEYE